MSDLYFEAVDGWTTLKDNNTETFTAETGAVYILINTHIYRPSVWYIAYNAYLGYLHAVQLGGETTDCTIENTGSGVISVTATGASRGYLYRLPATQSN